MTNPSYRIAVIGAGAAGITAAHLLQSAHEVTLLEKNNYLGGHTNTVRIETGADAGLAVDTGFIVLNDKTYPTLHRLLADLCVPVQLSDMSFSYSDGETGIEYAGTTLNGLFAQRRNLLRPSFLSMLRDLVKFSRLGLARLDDDSLTHGSLRELLAAGGFGRPFLEWYLLPMGAAIWSAPYQEVLDFPARTFVRFFANHGLLSLRDRPRWQTVEGGSSAYVQRFKERFRGTVRISQRITRISRSETGVMVHFEDEDSLEFDKLVIAAHADEALALLEMPTTLERSLLGAWRYQKNEAVLHTDESFLPRLHRARASWNYHREPGASTTEPASVTYHMNRLQGFTASREYCVTLNPRRPIRKDHELRRFTYHHPVYSEAAIRTQPELPALNGTLNTYYCGSYFGYGFHEDAVRSGANVAAAFGVTL